MTFREAMQKDVDDVWLNTKEFARDLIVYLGGKRFELRGIFIQSERKNRESFQYKDDFRKGIYRWDAKLYLDEDTIDHFPKSEEPVVVIDGGREETYRVRNAELQDGMYRITLNIYGD